jgi:hypothetical protein
MCYLSFGFTALFHEFFWQSGGFFPIVGIDYITAFSPKPGSNTHE